MTDDERQQKLKDEVDARLKMLGENEQENLRKAFEEIVFDRMEEFMKRAAKDTTSWPQVIEVLKTKYFAEFVHSPSRVAQELLNALGHSENVRLNIGALCVLAFNAGFIASSSTSFFEASFLMREMSQGGN